MPAASLTAPAVLAVWQSSPAYAEQFLFMRGVQLALAISKEIKADFNELYHQMNGMPLREMDKVIYPVCKLCRDHEKAGFTEGIKIGIRIANELV